MYDSLLDVDPALLHGEELTAHIRSLEAMQVRLDSVRLATLAEWDRQQAWADDGSATAGGRLARETGMPASTAREKVRVASKLASMPLARASMDAGRIGWSKVRALVAVINERTEQAFERDEAMLVEHAEQLTCDQLTNLLRHWQRLVDEDGANAGDDAMHAMHARQYVQLSESWEGEGFLKGRLAPENRAIVKSALDEISDELYRAERAEAGGGGGDAVASLRGASERCADALVEMARRSRAVTDAAASGAEVTPAVPMIMINIDIDLYGNVLARLADGHCLDEGALRPPRQPPGLPTASACVDLGRATRTPNRAQRRAMAAMWSTCAHPSCDRPFAWCQLHHIHHWILGGPTDLHNLLPLCSRHHHLHHKGVFDIQQTATGIEFRYPDGALIGHANPTIPQLLAPLRDIRPAA